MISGFTHSGCRVQRELCKALHENGDLQIRISLRTRRVVVAIITEDQEQILFDEVLEEEFAR
jgi:Holliday junction resolvase